MHQEYFDFLRFCLHDNDALPSSAATIDWSAMLDFAQKQSIVGVLFHGIKRLTKDTPHPTARQLALWGTENNVIASTNKQVYADAYKATAIMYQKYHHRSCVLKGQGNALMYPDPYMRTPGDIDLWVVPNEGEDIADIVRLCRQIDPGCELQYHHAEAKFCVETDVEIHYRPSFSENLIFNSRMQQYFDDCREEQVKTFVDLPDGLGRICVPTDSFNRVFQLSHIMKHFLFEGIGLRHVIDYFYLLRRGTSEEEKQAFVKEAKRLGMLKFARGLMYVLSHYLGLESKYLITEPDKRTGEFIMVEILETGNFGKADERFTAMQSDNRFLSAFYSIIKSMRFAVEFPSEVLLGHATWILWWHFYYRKKIESMAKGK